MEIENEIYNKILEFVSESKKNKSYEFEVRIGKKTLTEDNYIKVFEKLTFPSNNNGLGFKYSLKNMLDVMLVKDVSEDDFENIRMTINGSENIKKYWINPDFEIEKEFIEKEKLDKIDDKNFNLRYSLNNEIDKQNIMEKNKNLLTKNTGNNLNKIYRLKNRYSILSDDGLFQFDLTSVKTGRGKNFREANVLKAVPAFEIEIEFIGNKSDTSINNDEIVKKLLTYINIILAIVQNNNILVKNSISSDVIESYKRLLNLKFDMFIAASPVTMHRINMVKSNSNINIYNKYAVSLKADGERHFLYTMKDGRVYLFNNNFEVIDTGYIDENYKETLIEGELVTRDDGKEFYAYDMLFNNGTDIRRRHLVNIERTSSGDKPKSRLECLDAFIKSNSRKIVETFKEKNVIKLTKKYTKFSLRGDGTDIFEKIGEIWESRKTSNFHVDGMIFTPIYEYYPMRGGSWSSLLKWKPPNLNSIDFLIKCKKNDNEMEIKSPFIAKVTRPDGKIETYIKQYKTVKLYVSERKMNANNADGGYKRNHPVEFNPFDMDETNSSQYNEAKIFIDEKDRMFAHDPITDEYTEIFDDTIVEMTYDDSIEDNGFKWKPIRYRRDKTNLYKNGADVYGNSHMTAKDIFKAIKYPLTEDMILTGKVPLAADGAVKNIDNHQYWATFEAQNGSHMERFPYQNFHNLYIKVRLYNDTSPAFLTGQTQGAIGKLLDLCSGKGVDITKIKKARYAEVVGMDIDGTAVKFAQEYYQKRVPMPKPKGYYVRGDSSKLIWPEQATAFTEADKIYTKKYIPTKYYFDTISIQFCVHYFFENEIKLRTIVQNLNDNLKIGGYVIGSCFDGERINNSFGKAKSIEGKTFSKEIMWKIEKKYTSKLSFTQRAMYGKEIDVFVKTIGIHHKEYLVNFKFFDAVMEAYGFKKVLITPFEEYYNELMNSEETDSEIQKMKENAKNMSEEEKRFSFLFSSFIYKKEKNSSDELLKKLIQQMEKEAIKKRNNNIVEEVVDADTEHTIESSQVI